MNRRASVRHLTQLATLAIALLLGACSSTGVTLRYQVVTDVMNPARGNATEHADSTDLQIWVLLLTEGSEHWFTTASWDELTAATAEDDRVVKTSKFEVRVRSKGDRSITPHKIDLEQGKSAATIGVVAGYSVRGPEDGSSRRAFLPVSSLSTNVLRIDKTNIKFGPAEKTTEGAQ